MPTYDYECEACGHEFEQFQSIKAEPVRKCPQCGRRKVRRLIGTGAGVIFKGSGFYQTDYRSESYKRGAEKEKTASSGGSPADKSTSPTTDKKPSGEASAKSTPAKAE